MAIIWAHKGVRLLGKSGEMSQVRVRKDVWVTGETWGKATVGYVRMSGYRGKVGKCLKLGHVKMSRYCGKVGK